MLIFSCPCDFLFFEKATKKWKKEMSYKEKSGEAFIINESIQVIQVKLKVIYYSWNLVDKRMKLLFSASKFFLPFWVIHMFQYARTEKNEIEDLDPFLKSLNWEIALPIWSSK